MSAYIIRRILYTVPIWIGVFLITFALFNMNDPLSIARINLPQAPLPALQAWVRNNNYHIPRYVNLPSDATTIRADGRVHPEFGAESIFYSQFFHSLRDMFLFRFGLNKNKEPIADAILQRIPYSLSITVPGFFLTLILSTSIALFVAYFRGTATDIGIQFVSVLMMSIALPVYLLAANFLFGRIFKLVPVYNHPLLPIFIFVLYGIGGQIRFFRTVFLDQIDQDYVRTARAKGLREAHILFRHVLPNSLIPILTSVVMALPFLITGSLLLEQFFGIPGMGDMLYAAIQGKDFQVIKVMVYLGSLLYMLGSLLTDLSYAAADPRVVLQ